MRYRNILNILIFLTILYALEFFLSLIGNSSILISIITDAAELYFVTTLLLKISSDPKLKKLLLNT